MSDGFETRQSEMRAAAGQLNDACAGMENYDMSSVAGAGAQCGHDGVASALDQFCANWTDGAKTMSQDATDAGTSLAEAATTYTTTEGNNEQRMDAFAPALGGGF